MTNAFKKVSITLAGLAALALGGSALAGAAGSSTTPNRATPNRATPAPGGSGPPPGFPAGKAPGTAAHEDAEKAVTGEAAEKARAAALKSVPGTAGAVTTDFFG